VLLGILGLLGLNLGLDRDHFLLGPRLEPPVRRGNAHDQGEKHSHFGESFQFGLGSFHQVSLIQHVFHEINGVFRV